MPSSKMKTNLTDETISGQPIESNKKDLNESTWFQPGIYEIC